MDTTKGFAPGDDRHLAERARAGDADSFGVLVDRHAPRLLRLAHSMLGDAGAAEDVVQETLLAAFAGTGSFRGESSIGTWLVSILVKQTARHRRRESLRRHASFDKTAPPAGRPHASTSDAKIDVNWAIGELDERFRDVIVLRELDGLSYDEIAKALALPRGTVESRLHRARAALRKKLAAYGK